MKDSENDSAVNKHEENHESSCAEDELHMHFHVGGCKCQNCNQYSQNDNTLIDRTDFTLQSCYHSIKSFENIHNCAVRAAPIRDFSGVALNLTFIVVEFIFQFSVCYSLSSSDTMTLVLL